MAVQQLGNVIASLADASGNSLNGVVSNLTLVNATSPAAASTVVNTALTGLGNYKSLFLFANLNGATGGNLDVYIQTSPDGGTTWVDYIHYPQLTAAVGNKLYSVTVSKSQGSGTAPVVVGIGTTPALAVNVVVGGEWSDRMRVVFVAGASTSAGASQLIQVCGRN